MCKVSIFYILDKKRLQRSYIENYKVCFKLAIINKLLKYVIIFKIKMIVKIWKFRIKTKFYR